MTEPDGTAPIEDGDEITDFPWLKPYMRVPGARFVSTPSFELLADAVEEACEDLGITVAYGNPGAGKTFALRVAVHNRCRLPVTWMEPQHKPTLLALAQDVLYEFGERDILGERRVLFRRLIDRFATPGLLIMDESQRLNAECIDLIRGLSDRPTSRMALAMAGGVHCLEVLNSEPQLARRSPLKIEFTRLDPDEVLDYAPRYHPMYEGLPPGLLRRIDDEYAHGMIGLWANMTKRLHVELGRHPEPAVTADTIEAALVRLDVT